MISTRSGEGKTFHLLSVLILLSAESSTTPTHQPSNGSSTQQFLADQMQLIQNLTTTIQNIQAQQNQSPQAAPPAPVDKHKEFMSHSPLTYSYSTDLLDAEDWLKTVTKKLEMTQCTDREMVLYTTGCL
jgi:hypothetical protein